MSEQYNDGPPPPRYLPMPDGYLAVGSRVKWRHSSNGDEAHRGTVVAGFNPQGIECVYLIEWDGGIPGDPNYRAYNQERLLMPA